MALLDASLDDLDRDPTQNTGVLMGDGHNRIYIHLLLPSIKDHHSLMSGIVPLVGRGTDTVMKEPAIRDA
jgi:hypothetical protein